jgi:hypothetical protein
MLAQA